MSLPWDNMTPQSEVFLDPMTGQVLRIYLDTVHLKGEMFTVLRDIVESGGGYITSNKEDASIWVVNPDMPHALGEERDGATILFAPWLLACTAYGSALGANEGNWCGFKVSQKNRINAAPKQLQKGKEKLDLSNWPTSLRSLAVRTPPHSLPPVDAISLTGAPPTPLESEWGALWADGKRSFSTKEKEWMADVIEWCLAQYPAMNLAAACDVLTFLGHHRSKESYIYYITKHLESLVDRSPHLLKFLLKIQSESQADVNHPASLPKAPRVPKTPKPSYYYEAANSDEEPGASTARKPFSNKDKNDFIRFVAARPNRSMEPVAGETANDVWAKFARQHPSHIQPSWRTWHQHRRDELRVAVANYCAGYM